MGDEELHIHSSETLLFLMFWLTFYSPFLSSDFIPQGKKKWLKLVLYKNVQQTVGNFFGTRTLLADPQRSY